ncbi:MAG: UDP-2,3-diacylglucosamine diphosphatase [Muribaculaceae bacterium]|nr:UDP-2,3-diacylglucosamine diphosphatase [Muribaculaceae bacterium]
MAKERVNTYFISDLHLGAPYFPDSGKAERRVVAFLDSIKNDAAKLILAGDILDYWYEYRYVVPKGYIRFFGKLAELSDSGVEIIWLLGNHDIWLFGYLQSEIGLTVADGPVIIEIDGKKYMVAHGDGLGKNPRMFMFLRRLFRSSVCQRLFSMINPRWTVPFAQRWSRSSRGSGTAGKQEDERDIEDTIRNIREYALDYTRAHPDVEACIVGHFHVATVSELPHDRKLVVLGDWINRFTYGVIRPGESIKLEKFNWEEDVV